jgi:hypothetical protein
VSRRGAVDAGVLLVISASNTAVGTPCSPAVGSSPANRPGDAALRELTEDTGLVGRVDEHLWTINHDSHSWFSSSG